MALKTVSLKPGEKQLIRAMMATPPDGTLATSQQMAEIYRRLELRRAKRLLDKISENLRGYALALEWEDLVSPDVLVEDLQEKLENEQVEVEQKKLERLVARIEKLSKETEHTLDEAFLRWLHGLGVQRDWRIQLARDKDGEVIEIEQEVPAEQLIVFADLMAKLQIAIGESPKE